MREKGKPPGRPVYTSQRQRQLREMLLARYETNPDFKAALSELVAHHERLLRTDIRLHSENWRIGGSHWKVHNFLDYARDYKDQSVIDEAKKWATAIARRQEQLRETVRRHKARLAPYLEKLKGLACEWGLRCDWATEVLHRATCICLFPPPGAEKFFHLSAPIESDPDEMHLHRIVVDVTYDPTDPFKAMPPPEWMNLPQYMKFHAPDLWHDDSAKGQTIRVFYGGWNAVEAVIVEEARKQRDAFLAQLTERDDVSIRHTEPSLPHHIHWLYLRICPQKDSGRPLGWSKIASFEDWGIPHLTSTAVQKAVEPLACELGIELPPLRPGRPKKY